jgi:hypothetical protein
MQSRKHLAWTVVAGWIMLVTSRAGACCPVAHPGTPVVNADQTVILVWDPQTQTEHFVRRASFEASGDDFGFIVPSPSRPELAESGNDAFWQLAEITAPDVPSGPGISCGCAASVPHSAAVGVQVLEEKEVAGLDATVLQSDSAEALADWLKAHDYAFSPAVREWAAPYVRDHWTFTALKLAKRKDSMDPHLNAAALRLSFKTARPLFPYREPRYSDADKALVKKPRLLRIYFLADKRYEGRSGGGAAWTGDTVWSDRLSTAQSQATADVLKVPPPAANATWWLTEFEDHWSYEPAPGDVYFAPANRQATMHRPSVASAGNAPRDATPYLMAMTLALVPLHQRCRAYFSTRRFPAGERNRVLKYALHYSTRRKGRRVFRQSLGSLRRKLRTKVNLNEPQA